MRRICSGASRAVRWLAVAVVVVSTTAAHGQSIDLQLSYGVYAKGFKGLNVDVEVAVENAGYSAQFNASTTGLVSFFVDWHIEAESEGAVDGRRPSPVVFKTRNLRGDTVRWVEMAYGDDSPPRVMAEPSVETDNRPAVSPEMTTGTIDPISALVGFLLATDGGARSDEICPGPAEIFDGRRRYDVSATVLDPRHFPGGGIAPFSGDAFGCQMDLVKLGGFKEVESSNRDILNSRVVMWLADVGVDGVMLPVRLEMKSRVGRMLVHLLQVRDPRGTVVFGES